MCYDEPDEGVFCATHIHSSDHPCIAKWDDVIFLPVMNSADIVVPRNHPIEAVGDRMDCETGLYFYGKRPHREVENHV
jgi:hypothetical protein